jgi:hypothetical protein
MSTILIWCALLGLYLLFAGEVSRNELACALVLASAGTAWVHLVRAGAPRRFAVVRAIAPVGKALARLPVATFFSGGALLDAARRGASAGRARRCRFVHGADDDPQERTRRALAVLSASLAPDRFVVTLARGDEALLHDLGAGAALPDERWLQ